MIVSLSSTLEYMTPQTERFAARQFHVQIRDDLIRHIVQ